jgi:hypothetical protein
LIDWACEPHNPVTAVRLPLISYGTKKNMSCVIELGPHHQYGFHFPFDENIISSPVISSFREPSSRLISAFLFDKGGMLPAGFPNRERDKDKIHNFVLNSQTPIIEYAKIIGISSCQTKMVLGYWCGFPYEIVPSDMLIVKKRLINDFAFIGISEDSKASAALFWAMLGSPKNHSSSAHLPQINHVRENSRHTKEIDEKLRKDLSVFLWRDQYDEETYLIAKQLFCQRCRLHNISTIVNCSMNGVV